MLSFQPVEDNNIGQKPVLRHAVTLLFSQVQETQKRTPDNSRDHPICKKWLLS